MGNQVTVPQLQQMKLDGRKIVGVVAWDYQIARIVDRAGVDLVSVGDTVGTNLWGHDNPMEVTIEQMIVVTQAVRRGTSHALVSVDYPYGPLQEGSDTAVRTAVRFVKEANVDMVKLDGAADFPEAVEAVARAGIPVFAQIGITPQTALRYGMAYRSMSMPEAHVAEAMTTQLAAEARRMEDAGASMIDFTNSGPIVGPHVVEAVSIPVIGGFGGGPWLDGRIRMAHAAIGYAAQNLDEPTETYANVAQITFDAISSFAEDVRTGQQIKGGVKTSPGRPNLSTSSDK